MLAVDMFEKVKAAERERVAAFLEAKAKEAHERMLAVPRAPAERAVAEMAGKQVELVCSLIADMLRVGVLT